MQFFNIFQYLGTNNPNEGTNAEKGDKNNKNSLDCFLSFLFQIQFCYIAFRNTLNIGIGREIKYLFRQVFTSYPKCSDCHKPNTRLTEHICMVMATHHYVTVTRQLLRIT